MILIENCKVYGWDSAIRGMRNPMNSWDQSDTKFNNDGSLDGSIGQNDYKLMSRLADAGQVHGKYLRMITVIMDVTAPLYWWKEADTYKIGTVTNSCSTMHKIHAKEFTMDDFSHEHLVYSSTQLLEETVRILNEWRKLYLIDGKKKSDWWQMIQLLPSSYNQKRTWQLNYAVLKNIYEYRHNHKLDEWVTFCEWIKKLPYSELITGTNDPLTWEELHNYIGKPVYIEDKESLSHWDVVQRFDITYSGAEYVYMSPLIYSKNDMGKYWNAYRKEIK